MNFSLEPSLQILRRTPDVLHALLQNIGGDWALGDEGPGTWSTVDVLGHLVYCDTHNWLLRIKHLLAYASLVFPPFDRNGHQERFRGAGSDQLLPEFRKVRSDVLNEISGLQLAAGDFCRKGMHPQFGVVRLEQLFAAWVVHDLSHLAQVSRVMAKQYEAAVGPWKEYLRILK